MLATKTEAKIIIFRSPSAVFVETADNSICGPWFHCFSDLPECYADFYCTHPYSTAVNEYEYGDDDSFDSNHSSTGPTPEEIYEEIVRECSELERRSFTFLDTSWSDSNSNTSAAGLRENGCASTSSANNSSVESVCVYFT